MEAETPRRNATAAINGAGDGIGAPPAPGRLMRPEGVAVAYWALHQQSADAWTFEQEIRPFGE